MIIMGDKKNVLTAILGPDGNNVGVRRGSGEDEEPDELAMIAQELIEAVHARNPKEVVEALRAAFMCLDSEPHVEGPHESEE